MYGVRHSLPDAVSGGPRFVAAGRMMGACHVPATSHGHVPPMGTSLTEPEPPVADERGVELVMPQFMDSAWKAGHGTFVAEGGRLRLLELTACLDFPWLRGIPGVTVE